LLHHPVEGGQLLLSEGFDRAAGEAIDGDRDNDPRVDVSRREGGVGASIPV
jgi:hypothetical protein